MQQSHFLVRNRIIAGTFALLAIVSTQQTSAATTMEEYGKELAAPKYLMVEEMPDPMEFLPPPPGWTSPLFAGDYAAYLWGKSIRPTERGAKAVEQAAYLFDEISAYFSTAVVRCWLQALWLPLHLQANGLLRFLWHTVTVCRGTSRGLCSV